MKYKYKALPLYKLDGETRINLLGVPKYLTASSDEEAQKKAGDKYYAHRIYK